MCVCNILRTGRCITMLFSPAWRSSPGKLRKLLNEWVRHEVRKRHCLEFSQRLCIDNCRWRLLKMTAVEGFSKFDRHALPWTTPGWEWFNLMLHIGNGETVPSTCTLRSLCWSFVATSLIMPKCKCPTLMLSIFFIFVSVNGLLLCCVSYWCRAWSTSVIGGCIQVSRLCGLLPGCSLVVWKGALPAVMACGRQAVQPAWPTDSGVAFVRWPAYGMKNRLL